MRAMNFAYSLYIVLVNGMDTHIFRGGWGWGISGTEIPWEEIYNEEFSIEEKPDIPA